MGFGQTARRLAASILILGLAAACGNGGGGPAAPLTDPIVAATVNDKPIFIDDVLAEAVARGAIREGQDLPTDSALFAQILEDLIETRLFAIEAEARGLDRNADVRHRLDIARERILANVLNENIADTALKESAIERMYREQVRLLKQGREVHARHILFDTREAALAAKRRLDAGEPFERLAYDLSKDRSSATEGGDLGYFLPEAMPDDFRDVCLNTEVGKVGGPVQTEQGWHLVKIEERREAAPPSLESLRPKIVQWLMFEEQRTVVEKLKTAARIARITDPGNVGVSPQRGLEAPEDRPAQPQPSLPRPASPAAPEAEAGGAATPNPAPAAPAPAGPGPLAQAPGGAGAPVTAAPRTAPPANPGLLPAPSPAPATPAPGAPVAGAPGAPLGAPLGGAAIPGERDT